MDLLGSVERLESAFASGDIYRRGTVDCNLFERVLKTHGGLDPQIDTLIEQFAVTSHPSFVDYTSFLEHLRSVLEEASPPRHESAKPSPTPLSARPLHQANQQTSKPTVVANPQPQPAFLEHALTCARRSASREPSPEASRHLQDDRVDVPGTKSTAAAHTRVYQDPTLMSETQLDAPTVQHNTALPGSTCTLASVFAVVDTDGDARVTCEDIAVVFAAHGVAATQLELEAVFESMDMDPSSPMQKGQFCMLVSRLRPGLIDTIRRRETWGDALASDPSPATASHGLHESVTTEAAKNDPPVSSPQVADHVDRDESHFVRTTPSAHAAPQPRRETPRATRQHSAERESVTSHALANPDILDVRSAPTDSDWVERIHPALRHGSATHVPKDAARRHRAQEVSERPMRGSRHERTPGFMRATTSATLRNRPQSATTATQAVAHTQVSSARSIPKGAVKPPSKAVPSSANSSIRGSSRSVTPDQEQVRRRSTAASSNAPPVERVSLKPADTKPPRAPSVPSALQELADVPTPMPKAPAVDDAGDQQVLLDVAAAATPLISMCRSMDRAKSGQLPAQQMAHAIAAMCPSAADMYIKKLVDAHTSASGCDYGALVGHAMSRSGHLPAEDEPATAAAAIASAAVAPTPTTGRSGGASSASATLRQLLRDELMSVCDGDVQFVVEQFVAEDPANSGILTKSKLVRAVQRVFRAARCNVPPWVTQRCVKIAHQPFTDRVGETDGLLRDARVAAQQWMREHRQQDETWCSYRYLLGALGL